MFWSIFSLIFFFFHFDRSIFRLDNVDVKKDFLKQIPRMAEITVPSDFLDWKSKELNLPANQNLYNRMNLSGKLELPTVVNEPHYVLIRSDGENPQHLGKFQSIKLNEIGQLNRRIASIRLIYPPRQLFCLQLWFFCVYCFTSIFSLSLCPSLYASIAFLPIITQKKNYFLSMLALNCLKLYWQVRTTQAIHSYRSVVVVHIRYHHV